MKALNKLSSFELINLPSESLAPIFNLIIVPTIRTKELSELK